MKRAVDEAQRSSTTAPKARCERNQKAVKRAIVCVACVVVLLAGSDAEAVNYCGGVQHQNTCGRPTNIYPCCPNGSNCTWWAWEMVCRNWGIGLVNWGNANTWGGYARNDPRFVVGGPQVGSIATSTLGNYGHVAWVVGVGAGTVTVTEQNCCATCSGSVLTRTFPTGKFNSGYVVRKGSQCQCAPGQTQTEACGSCGTRTRGCDGCNWGGWSACGGSDPNGGNVACDNGGKGVCAEARQRCVGGNVSCQSLQAASAEVCDGLDNDCNGASDDGHPPVGANRPAFAATLLDSSYPGTLKLGEKAMVWAEFRNDGTQAWTRDNLWLAAEDDTRVGSPKWPAFNVAAVLEQPVQPNETARFAFEIVATFDTTGKLTETFTLKQPNGTPVICPRGDVTAEIRVLRADGSAFTLEEEPAVTDEAPKDPNLVVVDKGCSAAPGLGLLSLALAALARSRRRAR